jgi:hypothetical protein
MKSKSKMLCLFGFILAVIIFTDLGFTLKETFESSRKANIPKGLFEKQSAKSAQQSALSKGIRRSRIAEGQEDLYILKSSIVPPICPACPSSANCPREKQCPPCPACARCPEPAFTCKKVPDYSAAQVDNTLPLPMLNSFSGFGK